MFPRARVFELVEIENVGDDVVALVREGDRIEYHTFLGDAFEIWTAMDGQTSECAIAERILGGCDAARLEMVALAVDELESAGLLETDAIVDSVKLSRRRATRIAAAGLAGMVGVPLVVSISAPSAEAAFTPTCVKEWEDTTQCTVGESCRCKSGCCCRLGTTLGACATVLTCINAGYLCFT